MAKDLYPDAVKTALIKDGWTIIEEGVNLQPDDNQFYFIDIMAERYLFARKEKEWIIVEVKTFGGKSDTYQLHSAIGQYITCYLATLLSNQNKRYEKPISTICSDLVYGHLYGTI